MSRYIDVECDCVKEIINRRAFNSREDIQDFLDNIPTADVAPVKHAKNLATQFDETICTNCGVHLGEVLRIVREDNGDDAVYYYQPKYCANCGAKFDGG